MIRFVPAVSQHTATNRQASRESASLVIELCPMSLVLVCRCGGAAGCSTAGNRNPYLRSSTGLPAVLVLIAAAFSLQDRIVTDSLRPHRRACSLRGVLVTTATIVGAKCTCDGAGSA